MTIGRDIEDLIVRYYCGTLDDEGARILAAWAGSSREAVSEFKSRLRLLEQTGLTTSEATAFLGRFEKKKADRNRFGFYRTVSLASMAVAAAVFTLILFTNRNIPSVDETFVDNSCQELISDNVSVLKESLPLVDELPGTAEKEPAIRKFSAPKDAILTVSLDDGTKVVLNKGTRMSVDARFGKETRTVTLDGEAFFDVAKDASRPFRIICRDEMYIVRGTSFNIQSYSLDGYSMVTLHTGSLEAHVKDNRIMLDPGDELFVDDAEDNFSKKKVDVSYSSRWINDGTLHFSGLALKYVAAQLSHKYGVRVSVHSSVSNIVYDGEIDKEPLDTALKLIAITAPTKLKITNLDGEYYITKY